MSYQDKLVRQTIQDYGDYDVSFNGIPGKDVPRIVNQAVVGSAGVIHRIGYAIISSTSEKEQKENPLLRRIVIWMWKDTTRKLCPSFKFS